MADIKISIEAARVNAKLTQKRVSELLGVSTQTLNAWEKDPSKIKVDIAYKLSELYNIPLDNLIFVH